MYSSWPLALATLSQKMFTPRNCSLPHNEAQLCLVLKNTLVCDPTIRIAFFISTLGALTFLELCCFTLLRHATREQIRKFAKSSLQAMFASYLSVARPNSENAEKRLPFFRKYPITLEDPKAAITWQKRTGKFPNRRKIAENMIWPARSKLTKNKSLWAAEQDQKCLVPCPQCVEFAASSNEREGEFDSCWRKF